MTSRVAVNPWSRAAKRLRAHMGRVIAAFLARQQGFIVGQVLVLRGKVMRKADLSDDERARIEEILSEVDFYGWATLAGDVEDIIAEATKDGGFEALRLLGFDVTAKKDVFNVVNEAAVTYGRERGAGLVGMRYQADGSLIVNPRAEFAITESTRDMLRADVSDAIAEGWTNAELASRLADNYAFSKGRAMTIARTETIRASNQGTLNGFKASGVVLQKEWTTAEDDLVSEDCQANGDQGPIDLEDSFVSGDDAPPAHPRCRCALVGLTRLDVPQPVTEAL